MDENTEVKNTRAHVYISGRVQGVSFRWNTQHKAQQLGLTGWVRNVWDGRVEAVFEGPEHLVKEAVAWCHHGSPPARALYFLSNGPSMAQSWGRRTSRHSVSSKFRVSAPGGSPC